MSEELLKVGDHVRLVKGKQMQIVIAVKEGHRGCRGQWIRAQYPSSIVYDPIGETVSWRPAHDYFKLIPAKVKEEMTKLYELKNADGTSAFGTLLAQNSVGKLVIEMKGSGEVRAVDPAEAVEVKPYTVSIAVDSDKRPPGAVTHYLSKPGALEKGDFVLFSNGRFGFVKAVDTKADVYQSLKNARKVVTEDIDAVDSLTPSAEDEE